jgi:Tfp pilus assembly ATPase PilU
MYQMDHLLDMLTTEKAKALRFRAGHPPIIVSDHEQHALQGPPLTGEEVMLLLRGMAASRLVRELQERSVVQFIYTSRGRSPFLVQAAIRDQNVGFDVS